MKELSTYRTMLSLVLLFFLARCQSSASKSSDGKVKRTGLQQQDLSIPGKECVQARIDFEPGASFGRHSHPGEEIIYVIEGMFEYAVDGKPAVTLTAGDVLFIPAGTTHAAKNIGTTNAAELATYIVEKGKQLVVLAQ